MLYAFVANEKENVGDDTLHDFTTILLSIGCICNSLFYFLITSLKWLSRCSRDHTERQNARRKIQNMGIKVGMGFYYQTA